MRRFPNFLLSMFVLIAFGTAASARDLYVNNTAGNDLFDGGDPTSADHGHGPYRTLTRALISALPGDRIVLAKTDEPYQESVTLATSRLSGSAHMPFVIEGNGAIFDGTRPVALDAWGFYQDDIFRFQPEKKQFQQLYLDGVPAVRHPMTSNPDRVPKLEPREWALVEGWIYFRVDEGRLPQQYRLSYSVLPNAFTLYKVCDVVIHDLVVQGYVIDGINMNDAHGPCVLSGVTCRGNGRSGVAVVGDSQAVLQDCLIGDNGHVQVLVDSYSDCNLQNCEVLGNTAPRFEVREKSTLLIDGKAPTASDEKASN